MKILIIIILFDISLKPNMNKGKISINGLNNLNTNHISN